MSADGESLVSQDAQLHAAACTKSLKKISARGNGRELATACR
jgi:hypothetical protein